MEVIHMENTQRVKNMMLEVIIEIVGIVVTIISIIVTLVSIRQSCGNPKHQKSNRPSQR